MKRCTQSPSRLRRLVFSTVVTVSNTSNTSTLLLHIACMLLLLDTQFVQCQRPLLNHTTSTTTYNAIATAQQHNYLGSGKQLRNGRVRGDMPQPKPTLAPNTNVQQFLQRSVSSQGFIPLYDDFDGIESSTGIGVGGTRVPPLNAGRRGDNRRRLNLNSGGTGGSVAASSSGRPGRVNGRRGIESLRRELMKPSVGGPGGGISGTNAGYPSYAGTSSIGKIDGLGSLTTADRYGEHLRPASSKFQPQFLVNQPGDTTIDNKPVLGVSNFKKSSNSISEIMKMNNNAKQLNSKKPHRQADEPIGGYNVTNGGVTHLADDDDEDGDPFQVIKDKIRDTAIHSSPYELHTEATLSSEIEDQLGVKCTFETPCAWKWIEGRPDGFQVISGTELVQKNMTGLLPGPITDALDDANGHFLYARLIATSTQLNLTSPQFSTTMEKCFLEVYMHQSDMSHGLSRVVVEPLHSEEGSWVPAEIMGDNFRQWTRKVYRLGRISRDFRIVFEVVPQLNGMPKAHVAIDNLRMVNCFPEGTKRDKCLTSQVKCNMNKVSVCIPLPRICDITIDCDDESDEKLNCDKIPFGGRCDFEDGWCGWHDSEKTVLSWSRHTGSSPTHDTGPDSDHTFQHLLNHTSGYYMLVNMNQHSNNSEKAALFGFASNAALISKTFNPPPSVHGNPESPYRNSCVIRFYVHQYGKNPGSINLSVVEIKEKENITTTLWWSTRNQGSDWLRAEYVLPNVTSRYYLQFEARMGMRIYSDVAIDDFSLSPECFGINIPEEYLNGYNYWDIRHNRKSPSHRDFEHKNYLTLTTCDTRGMIGPTQMQCEAFYKENNKTHVLKEVRVIEDQSSYKGMQRWKVPHEGYYTIIAKGASGGLGSGGVGSSRGAMSIAVLELHKNEELYILVGQQGENACIKSMSQKEEGCGSDEEDLDLSKYSFSSKQDMIKNIYIEKGAGGGGGGTYVFLLNSAKNEAVPLVIAGGGGGLGIGQFIDEDFQHGQRENRTREGVTGQIHGEPLNKKTAGPGGGWRAKADQALSPKYGAALLQGGRGGHSCYVEIVNNGSVVNKHGQGGFGGGGGGCNTGGGGGGYAGGDVYLNESNGEGGNSFISSSRSLKDFSVVYDGASSGAGSIIVIPAIEGCGCDYRCIALDEYRAKVRCICPDGWRLRKDNNTACEVIAQERIPFIYLIGFFLFLIVALGAALTALIIMLYNRYQRKKHKKGRTTMLHDTDLQLERLRNSSNAEINLSNFNPLYGCDERVTLKMKNIPRENLRLVKALGTGAFGEVYQGLYRKNENDIIEQSVAVKTLPEMSTRQSEEDFYCEASIMSKFDHPNMVRFIGVCFERHPRFIVLELLSGGDLKNFLREHRLKSINQTATLTLRDLVSCALDVCKGCEYMASRHFIHRDIAARNCLLSTKGPGRIVKIADFGMARDIYRSDYYRKDGRAMLPIKWMPPEAFSDGIFTSKTDCWSFGVTMWEIFSVGMMPYPGWQNQQVMKIVSNGARLYSPPGCPKIIFRIMADCWNPLPDDRPSFTELRERLEAEFTSTNEEMDAPLPAILFRPPTSESAAVTLTQLRCGMWINQSSDYLVPLPNDCNDDAAGLCVGDTGIVDNNNSAALPLNSCTTPALTSVPATNYTIQGVQNPNAKWGETSFTLPNSKSDQPLLSGCSSSVNASQRSINVAATSGYCDGYSSSAQHSSPAIQSKKQEQQQQLQQNGIGSSSGTNSASTFMQHNGEPEVDEDTKLISLDTPQPTPTTIQPPLSFSTQLDGITLDPAALAQNLNHKNSAATLTAANKQSYANIQMMTAQYKLPGSGGAGKVKELQANGGNTVLYNGTANNNGGGAGVSANGSISGSGSVAGSNGDSTVTSSNAAPFTIQGYSDRFNDNHSEISC